MDASASASSGPATAVPGARSALALLLLINLFNYIDRQVLAAVEPEIRKELLVDVGEEKEAKFWMGLLSTAFLVSYMLIAPIFGILADRMRRWVLVGIGVIIWSVASGASGWHWTANVAVGYWLLLATRCFVGVGEGAYGPIAPAMISDLYPVRQRGQVMAWFYLAIPVGGALGYAFGEVVQSLLHWRWAFYLVVPPGIALGIACFFMREPPRGQADSVQTPGKRASMREILSIFKTPSYVLNTLGMTAMTFAIGGLAWWMPGYLEENQVPGVGPIGARTVFGIITAVAGLFATLLGGFAGDWLRPRFSGSYFIVSGMAMLLGAPMLVGFLNTPFPWAWIFVFFAVFCLFFNTGPTNTILANVTHPSVRASAFAINILIIHLLGDAISPPIIGWIADRKGELFIFGRTGLDGGFMVTTVLMVAGGLLWLWGSRYLDRDTALAPTRM